MQAACGRPASIRSSRTSRFGPISTAFQGRPQAAIGLRALPQGEAFVVLRSQRDVLRAGALEDIGPVVGIVELGAEHRGEIEVREIGAVDALVEFPGRRPLVVLVLGERVPIPLGVAGLALDIDGGEGRHGVDAPVDEDAELGVGVPLRARTPVDRVPVGFVAGLGGGGHRERSGRHGAEHLSP